MWGYDEIAAAVDKSTAAVRQIAHRARRHVEARRPREMVTAAQTRAALASFRQALPTGDLQGLLDLLAPDVVLVAGGGGLRQAALRPILGAAKLVRYLAGTMAKNAPPPLTADLEIVNASPALVVRLDGVIDGVIAVRVEGGRVSGLYYVRNPDRLTGRVRDRARAALTDSRGSGRPVHARGVLPAACASDEQLRGRRSNDSAAGDPRSRSPGVPPSWDRPRQRGQEQVMEPFGAVVSMAMPPVQRWFQARLASLLLLPPAGAAWLIWAAWVFDSDVLGLLTAGCTWLGVAAPDVLRHLVTWLGAPQRSSVPGLLATISGVLAALSGRGSVLANGRGGLVGWLLLCAACLVMDEAVAVRVAVEGALLVLVVVWPLAWLARLVRRGEPSYGPQMAPPGEVAGRWLLGLFTTAMTPFVPPLIVLGVCYEAFAWPALPLSRADPEADGSEAVDGAGQSLAARRAS